MVTITDTNGETIAWASAGTQGFKGARKSTPFAATRAGESAGQKARKLGMSEIEVRIRGSGAGRESAVNGLVSTGMRVTAVEDRTPVPHNGCRPAKRRRV
jgi:small subunit ribosomal protein S11